MPVTPNLQPDEFEITAICPVGACLAQTTCAFSRQVLTQASYIKDAKEQMMKTIIKAHENGKHKRDQANGR